jgi:hypothetical protein
MSKKYINFIQELSYMKKKMKRDQRKYFDIAAKLYLERKMEKKTSLYNITFGLVSSNEKDIKKAIKNIEKFIDVKPSIGIKEKGSVYNEAIQPKNYHITATIGQRIEYHKQKKSFLKPIIESLIIKAKSEKAAKKLYMQQVEDIYNIDDDTYQSIGIEFVGYDSVVAVSTQAKHQLQHMRMKNIISDNVTYDYINEYKNFLDSKKIYVCRGQCGWIL